MPLPPSESESIVVGPLQNVTFRVEGREFQACLDDEGQLRVFITGRRNGKLYILPEGNNSITLLTEKPGMPRKEK